MGNYSSSFADYALKQDWETCRTLLTRDGTDVKRVYQDGNSALHLAIECTDIIVMLLELRADVDATNKDERTALHLCAMKSQPNDSCPSLLETAVMLIDNGADVNALDAGGCTPLHLTSNLKMAQLLVDRNAYVLAVNKAGDTPAEFAREAGEHELADFLEKAGASLWTLAQNQHWKDCNDILARGSVAVVNIDETSSEGKTALHFAAEHNCPALIRELIQRGADIKAKDEDSRTPLHLALAHGHFEAVELLAKTDTVNIQSNDGSTALHVAAMTGDTETIDVILSKKPQLDATDMTGLTPLLRAAKNYKWLAVKHLTKKKADVLKTGPEGRTALHYAAANDQIDVIHELMKHRADVNASDEKGDTPLHFAVHAKKLEAAKVLANYEADLTAKNRRDERPITAPDSAKWEGNDWLLRKHLSDKLGVIFTSIRIREKLDQAVEWSVENNADGIDDVADNRLELAGHLNLQGIKQTGLVRALEPYARFKDE